MGLFGKHKKRRKVEKQSATTAEMKTAAVPEQTILAADVRAAAEKGDMQAQYNYGLMYYNGDGVPKDPSKAFEWFEKSAIQGNADAQSAIGMLYDDGIGTKQDKAKALYWYEKAGEQGMSDYSYICAVMYDSGIGIEVNKEKAAYWYEKAARQGNSCGQFEYGILLSDRGENTEALNWFEKAAKQGEFLAQFNCGILYHGDSAVVENPERALYWFLEVLMSKNAAEDERRTYAAARKCVTLFRDGYGTIEQIHAASGRTIAMPILMMEHGEAEYNWTELTEVLCSIEQLRKEAENLS